MTRVFEVFSGRAADDPICPDESGTGWLELGHLCAAVEALCKRLDEQQGSHTGNVAVVVQNRYWMLAACLAIWRSGRIAVFPPNHKPGSIAQVMADSQASWLITDLEHLPRVHSGTIGVPLQATATAPVPKISVGADQRVLTVFTSGTTGEHQRCDKTAAQLFGEARVLAELFEFDSRCIVAATVPAHHLYGLLFTLLVPLFSGARFLCPALFQPAHVRHAVAHHRVTDLITVPTHIRALVAASKAPGHSLRRVFSSGAMLDLDLAKAFCDLSGSAVVDILGSTESGGIAWRYAKPLPYTPLPGVQVSADASGQLLLSSPFLPPGSGWQKMQDKITLVPGGFEHQGRSDGVLKLGGKRIAVQELEARARNLAGVEDAVVLVESSSHLRGTELWLVVATHDPRWTAQSLKRELGRHFDAVVLPRRYRTVPELPRDAFGKLQRRLLQDLFGATPGEPEQRRSVSCQISIPQDWIFFRGHFPTNPILAGAAQLTEVVLPNIARAWGDLHTLKAVPLVKYRRPIRPGARLALNAHRHQDEPLVDFELWEAGELATHGQLSFVAP